MKRLAGGLVIALMLIGAGPPARPAPWIAVGEASPPRQERLTQNGGIKLARIFPKSLIVSESEVLFPNGRVLTPSRTLFIQTDDPNNIYCELKKRASIGVACLIDADRDGKFESYFITWPGTDYYFYSITSKEKIGSLSSQVPYHVVQPKAEVTDVNLWLYMPHRGVLGKKNTLDICYLRDDPVPRRGLFGKIPPTKFCRMYPLKVSDDPDNPTDIYGRQVSLVANADGSSDVRIKFPANDVEI